MLSALIAIAFVLGLFTLNAYVNKRELQAKLKGGKRFDINDSLYGYFFNSYYVLIFRETHEEMFRIDCSKIQSIVLGSQEIKSSRKSAEVVVLEWLQENGAPKSFCLDIEEPNSRENADNLINFLKSNLQDI